MKVHQACGWVGSGPCPSCGAEGEENRLSLTRAVFDGATALLQSREEDILVMGSRQGALVLIARGDAAVEVMDWINERVGSQVIPPRNEELS